MQGLCYFSLYCSWQYVRFLPKLHGDKPGISMIDLIHINLPGEEERLYDIICHSLAGLSLCGSYKGEIKMTVQKNKRIQNAKDRLPFSTRQLAEETTKALRELQDRILKQEVLLAEKDTELAKAKSALAEKTMDLAKIKTALAEKDMALLKIKAVLSEKDTALVRLKATLAEKDVRIASLISEIKNLKNPKT